MSNILIITFLMMGAAFLIGFAVAYLIKIISASLNYFENFSLSHQVVVMKRLRHIRKIRVTRYQQLFTKVQMEVKDDLLDYFFPYQKYPEKKIDNQVSNELIQYYYGKD